MINLLSNVVAATTGTRKMVMMIPRHGGAFASGSGGFKYSTGTASTASSSVSSSIIDVVRGGGENSGDHELLLFDKIFSTRIALKVVAIGLFAWSFLILLLPQIMSKYIMESLSLDDVSSSSVTQKDFYLFMWGIRELILGLVSWKISSVVDDELLLGRYMVTLLFACISIPQVLYIINKQEIFTQQYKSIIIGFQICYMVYLGITTCNAWNLFNVFKGKLERRERIHHGGRGSRSVDCNKRIRSSRDDIGNDGTSSLVKTIVRSVGGLLFFYLISESFNN